MVLQGHLGPQPRRQVARPDPNPKTARNSKALHVTTHKERCVALNRQENLAPNPLRNDKETEATLRINQVETEREIAVQDV